MPNTPNDGTNSISPKPTIVAWLRDRRIIAIAESNYATIEPVAGATNAGYGGQLYIPLWTRLPDLRHIEWVLDINLFSDPKTDVCLGAAYNKKISGNIVGFTVIGMTNFPTGTTIFAEVVAVGPP